ARPGLAEIALRPAVVRDPERLPGPEHEPLDADGLEQRGEMVLRRPPDPADVPPDAGGFLGSGPEVHLLDERAVGVRDDETDVGVAPYEGAHRRRRDLGGSIVGVPLAGVLAPPGAVQRPAPRPPSGGAH